MIEFDVETRNLQWTHDAAGLHLVAFDPDDEVGPRLCEHPEDTERVRHWLGKDDGYRGWNTKFDLHVLKSAGYELPPESQWHDGMVAAHIADERNSVALKVRGEKLFGEEAKGNQDAVQAWLREETKRRRKASKDEGHEFVEPDYSDVPMDIMEPYAKGDVELTRRIGEVYAPQIEGEFKDLYALEMDVMRALFHAEDRGIPMDRDALCRLEAELLPNLDRLHERCVELSEFDNFNPRSPKQISEALERQANAITKAGGKHPETGIDKVDPTRHMSHSATGQLVTDEENLSACDLPLAEAILSYRGEHKLYAMLRGILHTGGNDSKFPNPYLTDQDRVHPNFRQLGARTGRMSCSNPNFQQVPRDDLRLRYAVAASPGHELVCCDLDSIELRILAMLAGEGAFRSAIVGGGDPHEQTAQLVGLTGRQRSTGATESPRDQGKRLNYLIVYGGGVRAIMKWFGVSQPRAREIMDRMHAAYPEVTNLQNRIDHALLDRGYVRSPLSGRRFRMYGKGPVAVQKEGYKFLNYLIQGTAADVMKIALARVHEAGVPVIACVHDEIIAEVPVGEAAPAACVIEEAFTNFPELTDKTGVPITASAEVVTRWSQVKKPDYIPTYMED